MALSEEQRRETADVAELQTQRAMKELFDHALPRMIQGAFSAHNADVAAHAKMLNSRFRLWKWALAGLMAGVAISTGSPVLVKLLGLLVG